MRRKCGKKLTTSSSRDSGSPRSAASSRRAAWDSQPPRAERKRHSRKYAEGNLGPDRSFYFRGPDGKLHLKAQNLVLFLQLADGVDDATWEYHLRRNDYSHWFRAEIKDAELATEAERVEADKKLSPQESRAAIRKAVEGRYTLPADAASGLIEAGAAEEVKGNR